MSSALSYTDLFYVPEMGNLDLNFGNLNLKDRIMPNQATAGRPFIPFDTLPASENHSLYKLLVQERLVRERDRNDMMNKNTVMHILRDYQHAVRSSNDQQYLGCLLRQMILRNSGFFFAALVFHEKGTRCVRDYIQKLKRTPYVDFLTQSLRPILFQMMTHPVANMVVHNCLKLLGPRSNLIIYEEVIYCCLELATDKVGCASLNECIDMIDGDQRKRLLCKIADFSSSLSHDLYGNYVVQHVLEQRESEVNARILCNLNSEFIYLSLTREGSHVVEKCLECCNLGAIQVVGEMLKLPAGEVLKLAGDEFGNFVVQSALKKVKEQKHVNLYRNLVAVLKDGKEELNNSPAGRHVLNCIKDKVQSETRTKSMYVRKQG